MTVATQPQPENNYFAPLAEQTIAILQLASAIAQKKETSSRKEYREMLDSMGWDASESKKYLKIAETFSDFDPEELAGIEPNTIFLLAKNNKLYKPVSQYLH